MFQTPSMSLNVWMSYCKNKTLLNVRIALLTTTTSHRDKKFVRQNEKCPRVRKKTSVYLAMQDPCMADHNSWILSTNLFF